MESLFNNAYKNRTVLVTGHTGFKGSWLIYWLHQMGAKVIGYSLEAPTIPNHIELLNLDIISVRGDIRDLEKLQQVFEIYKPDIVFHLAAQPLVRLSYENPIETYETNVMGSLKVFEACRKNGVKAIVNITSDKAYENKEWLWGYRENDPMGGYDPYSSSKGCADILASSYRQSYFNPNEYNIKHSTLLATCRAGNVVGGGDWAADRLMCDAIRSTVNGESVILRNPTAIRPWQHVLDPLSGYLLIGQKLIEGDMIIGDAWNFGPLDSKDYTVTDIIHFMQREWDKITYTGGKEQPLLHEANLLKLDCTKAVKILQWEPIWDTQMTIEKTVKWYKKYYEENIILTENDLLDYIGDARLKKAIWTTQ